ncbi:hypothetical protein [uncultured Desulfobacter sp.]|uniref:hypothetical protein n=1 Tax=uncultured Desulfobacter sp. TaxID=240139 RepID=UPI002AAB2259|nr:hypothetical protein [uncultured Desulfobacter sp.]
MSNYGDYPDTEHLCAEHSAEKDALQKKHPHNSSGPREEPNQHVENGFKDYFCPFCGYRLFRGKVRDFKMVCHECNRLVDSKTLEK